MADEIKRWLLPFIAIPIGFVTDAMLEAEPDTTLLTVLAAKSLTKKDVELKNVTKRASEKEEAIVCALQ